MKWQSMIIDGYERCYQDLEEALKGLTPKDLDRQPHPECNSMGWTAWHLARVQDAQVAALVGKEQVWMKDRWYIKFGRKANAEDTGYGDKAKDVGAFRSPDVKTVLAYFRPTLEESKSYIKGLKSADLDRKLDEPWYQPLPTVGVRLVSMMTDAMQHAGEVSYIRGLLAARREIEG